MIEWLLVMFPLVFSPGPANIIASISGARVGIRGSLPLFAGINVVYFSYSMIIGVGLGEILLSVPPLLIALRFIGAAFVIWLGVRMWLRSKKRDNTMHLGFREGVLMQSMNPKFPIILLTMFSVFLIPGAEPVKQVLTLSVWILVLNLFTQFTWAIAGKLLSGKSGSKRTNETEDRFFSVLLILVGVWIGLR
ncbi:MAG: LysE family translocator [Gammaproteobacteria bacterium]|nr:LysE family translocator [Gammaproteobacteria bacterium]